MPAPILALAPLETLPTMTPNGSPPDLRTTTHENPSREGSALPATIALERITKRRR
mgnify:CR=1 FL=1